MSAIGAELPPHLLAKRKRKQEEDAKNEATTTSGATRPASSGDGEKRRRVIGPAMPPVPLDEKPDIPPEHSKDPDSDDDDFGPSLPPNQAEETEAHHANNDETSDTTNAPTASTGEKPKRDEWMTMPPKQDDLAARLDPTKQRPRAFNTGKGARGPHIADEDSSAWNETPEQKQKRLADEIMGVTKTSTSDPQRQGTGPATLKDEAAAKKIKEKLEKARGPSLVDQHKQSKGVEAEDDPSKRAFDREKDMGSGMRIGHAQKRELLNKASNFSSKFSGGSYL